MQDVLSIHDGKHINQEIVQMADCNPVHETRDASACYHIEQHMSKWELDSLHLEEPKAHGSVGIAFTPTIDDEENERIAAR